MQVSTTVTSWDWEPAEIPFPRGIEVACVSSGDHHCAAVATTGQLFFWGQGSFGQLGHGKYSNVQRPTVFSGGIVVHPSVTLGLRPQNYYHNQHVREEAKEDPSHAKPGDDCKLKPDFAYT